MSDGLSYTDRQFITAAILTAPRISGGMTPDQIAQTFKQLLVALTKSGAYEALADAATEARSKGG